MWLTKTLLAVQDSRGSSGRSALTPGSVEKWHCRLRNLAVAGASFHSISLLQQSRSRSSSQSREAPNGAVTHPPRIGYDWAQGSRHFLSLGLKVSSHHTKPDIGPGNLAGWTKFIPALGKKKKQKTLTRWSKKNADFLATLQVTQLALREKTSGKCTRFRG